MPSGSEILGCQPSARMRVPSISLRGVPSGWVVSHSISPS